MNHNYTSEKQQAIEAIQKFCTKKIIASDAGTVLFCLLAARDGFLTDRLIDSVKDEVPREALRRLLTLQESPGQKKHCQLKTISGWKLI